MKKKGTFIEKPLEVELYSYNYLHYIARKNDFKSLHKLLMKCEDVKSLSSINEKSYSSGEEGYTPLELVKTLEMAAILIRLGADAANLNVRLSHDERRKLDILVKAITSMDIPTICEKLVYYYTLTYNDYQKIMDEYKAEVTIRMESTNLLHKPFGDYTIEEFDSFSKILAQCGEIVSSRPINPAEDEIKLTFVGDIIRSIEEN